MTEQSNGETLVKRRDTLSRQREPAHPTRAQEPAHPPVHGEQHDAPWEQPSNLTAPPPRPGMAQRWIRTGVQNTPDATNVAKAFREGWQPRRADTVEAGFTVPTISHGEFAGVIGIHGMILCEMPQERLALKREFIAQQTKRQTQAVARSLAEQSHPNMPISQVRKTEVTRGKQRVPLVGDDDIE